MDREVRVELSNQGNWRRMTNIQQWQLVPTLKVALMVGSSSSSKTLRSTQIFLLKFKVSYISLFFSLRNNSLWKEGSEEEEAILWALVFLGMVLG